MAKTTQDGRTISINTPLGKDYLLLEKVHAEEKISELFEIDVSLLYDSELDDKYTIKVINDTSIVGQTVSVEIKQDDGGKRTLTGMVVDFTLVGRDRRYTRYFAKIVPHIWKLTRNFQSKIFQHKTVREILHEVLDGFEFKDQCQADYKPRNYCVQYQETDFDFISRIMEEEGIYYYFEHTPEAEKLILRDDFKVPEDCPYKSEIPFFIEDLTSDWFESAIKDWQIIYKLQSGQVTLWDYHFQDSTKNFEAKQSSICNVGGNRELEVYTYQGRYALKYDNIDKSGGERSDLSNIFQDNTRTSKNRIAMHDAQYKTAAGWSDCCTMTPGYRFQLKNHPNKDFNTKYILLSVIHDVEQSPGYQTIDVPKAYTNQFTCIPHGSGCAEFRPPLKTRKPIMYGSQTAIVVGPGGEEIFTDKYGRVKVQFHWDRDNKYNPDSSCWVRVAHDLAGKKWGEMHIPRIGQEVIVDFMEGNPDLPIIVGSVYNDKTMPHYELPKYKTLTYLKTRTTPDDGKGFNEWRFEDKKGKEQVFIHSQKRMDVRVRQSLYETCGGNRHEVIGVRSSTYSGENYPGGNLAVTVGGNHDFHVKEDEFIGIDGKRYEKVVKDVVEGYKADQSTIVTGKFELNAREIIIEAGMKISLKVGGNCIVIDPTGIIIAGTPTVKINSGGFGTETSDPMLGNPLDAEPADTGEPGYLDKPRYGGGRGGRVWEQLKSQHYIAPPRKGEDSRITNMRGTLASSAQGRHALEVYDRYGIEPTFNAGKGSTYNPSTNKTNLDPSEDPTTSALTFVHEMNHGEAANEKKSGDMATQNKSDYVNTMVDEETEGTVRSIEARNELKKNGTDVSGSHFPLENEYQAAHDKAVADAKAANPGISDADAEAAGRKAGRDAVKDGFNTGKVVTSNTKEKYPDYYGNDYDKQPNTLDKKNKKP